MVIASRNPVQSVLFLILAFVNAAGLFLLLGAEFLAMILVVVYVGAVAVLFLFVVMMLDVDFAELRQGFLQYLPVGALIGVIFLIELVLVVGAWTIDPELIRDAAATRSRRATGHQHRGARAACSTRNISTSFQAAGLMLLVAMIGAIVLTLRERSASSGRTFRKQVARTQETPWRCARCLPQGLEEWRGIG